MAIQSLQWRNAPAPMVAAWEVVALTKLIPLVHRFWAVLVPVEQELFWVRVRVRVWLFSGLWSRNSNLKCDFIDH